VSRSGAPRERAAKATSLADLKKSREILATAPSGAVLKIRPLNAEHHALNGGLPAHLVSLALGGEEKIDETLKSIASKDDEDVTPEEREERAAISGYLDGIVRTMILEPSLPEGEPVDDYLLPVDYRWLVQVAMGEEDEDGEGRRLWGRDPISRWETFRHFHGCPEDCAGCRGVRDLFSAALG
jgi:hypothetical protein